MVFAGFAVAPGLEVLFGGHRVVIVVSVRRLSALALPGFHPRIFLVDDEGPPAAADDLGARYFLQGPQRVPYFHELLLCEVSVVSLR